MTHTYSIGKMLEIKDKNIKLDDKITEEETDKGRCTDFYGTLTYTPKGCMKCGVVNHSHADIVKNGTKTSTIKLDQYNFKLVVLKLKKQRFLCKHCGKTFSAETSLVDRHCFISNPLKYLISLVLCEVQSMLLFTKLFNISSITVLRYLL